MDDFQERLRFAWQLAKGTALTMEAIQKGQNSSRARQALRVVPGAQLAKFALKNRGGRRIVGRYMEPPDAYRVAESRCVVVYCPSEFDGGAGAEECLPLCLEVLPLGIAVFAIDLTPTKQSLCRLEDVECAVAALRDGSLPGLANTSHCLVALWGRSTGAVAALQYATQDPSVAALVMDSAYSDLTNLAPMAPLFSPVSNFCQLLGNTSFVQPLEVAKSCFVPGFILHAAEDRMVPSDCARDLRSNYAGEAQVLLMPKCSHDSHRPGWALARASLFLARAFKLENSAVAKLDLYLTKVVSSEENLDKQLERQAEDLLKSNEPQLRLHGLLLKAANACGHRVGFHRSLAKGQKSRGRNGVLGVHYAVLIQLPRFEHEVCIAWASESTECRGMVHFLTISCTSLSISRAVIRRDENLHRVAVQDLMVKDLKLLPREKAHCLMLTLSDFGRIDVKIGNAQALQFPGTKDCGALESAALWTAAMGDSRLPQVKDELLPAKLIPVADPCADPIVAPKAHAKAQALEEASLFSLDSLPASAAELAMQMQQKAPNPVVTLQDKEDTSMVKKKRYSSEMSNVAPSELTAGTFLSKANDSLALSLPTVSDEEESLTSSNSTELVRSHTWPDMKEPQLEEVGRRHSWAVADRDLLPAVFLNRPSREASGSF